jgi:deoxyribodipyrimidine photo-lyase
VVLHEPDEVLKGDGDPYRVFTPYFRRWAKEKHPRPVAKPGDLASPAALPSDPLPTLATWGLSDPAPGIVEGGERAARQRLRSTIKDRLARYDAERDIPSAESTSRLSQDLRFGTLSIRTVLAEVDKARAKGGAKLAASADTFLSELAWREFYMQILSHFPEVLDLEFNADYRGLPWNEPDDKFAAWQEGLTGFPFVDAGMRQLRGTGFMHNRVRMVVAMFLTKDLHIDWRLGEQFFMQELVDGEIASNNGGWQWSAGTGADAAPYFRIQNPWTQGKRFDPDGCYIRKWVPELADVPAKALHAPPADDQPIAADYPLPIVDHKEEREYTLRVFKEHLAQRR